MTQLVPLASQIFETVAFVVVQFRLELLIVIAGVASGILVRWLILWALFVGTGAAVPLAPDGGLNLGSTFRWVPFPVNR